MQELTPLQQWIAIIIALFGGGAGVKLIGLGLAQLNAVRDRRKAEKLLNTTASVELKRVDIEADKAEDERRERLDARKDAEIERLERKLKECEASITLSRPTVTLIYKALYEIEQKTKTLRVAKCPDEVAEIINERILEVNRAVGAARDLLP